MRILIPFAVVMAILSAASAPRNGELLVTHPVVADPFASPLHPRLLQFFAPRLNEPVLILPDMPPHMGAVIDHAARVFHI